MSERVKAGQYYGKPHAVEVDGSEVYAQLGLSKNSGTKQVLVMFEIVEGPSKGVVLPWFGYFTKDSAERTVESLRLIGFTGQDIFDLENQKLDGRVSLTVENNEWEGKVQSRVAWVNDPNYVPTIEIKSMNDKDRDSFRKQLAGILGNE